MNIHHLLPVLCCWLCRNTFRRLSLVCQVICLTLLFLWMFPLRNSKLLILNCKCLNYADTAAVLSTGSLQLSPIRFSDACLATLITGFLAMITGFSAPTTKARGHTHLIEAPISAKNRRFSVIVMLSGTGSTPQMLLLEENKDRFTLSVWSRSALAPSVLTCSVCSCSALSLIISSPSTPVEVSPLPTEDV